MAGRTIVITGASDGLGAAAAQRLHRSGEHVVVVGRSPQKTEAVATPLGADYFIADFADLTQVRELANQLLSRYPRIDVLANNAGGIMSAERATTIDAMKRPSRSIIWRRSCSPACCSTGSSRPAPR